MTGLYDGAIFERDGLRFHFASEHDESMGAPWEEHDGHGPVSGWTRRDKAPGELVLHADHGAKRYYDFAEAVKIAKRDGWDAPPYKTGTKGEIAARAALADFEHLRRWCNDQWSWIGVVVTLVDEDDELIDEFSESLWGIESESGDYLETVAHELADEIVSRWSALGRRMGAVS